MKEDLKLQKRMFKLYKGFSKKILPAFNNEEAYAYLIKLKNDVE